VPVGAGPGEPEVPESTPERVASGDRKVGLIIHVTAEGPRAFVNRCPHQGTPLHVVADHFLDAEGEHFVCSTHGARFRITDGVCVSGPCLGAGLAALPVRVAEGWLHVSLAPAVRAGSSPSG
jgi:nitrite reductase/ring-hydroxylating ferredoxin subunit